MQQLINTTRLEMSRTASSVGVFFSLTKMSNTLCPPSPSRRPRRLGFCYSQEESAAVRAAAAHVLETRPRRSSSTGSTNSSGYTSDDGAAACVVASRVLETLDPTSSTLPQPSASMSTHSSLGFSNDEVSRPRTFYATLTTTTPPVLPQRASSGSYLLQHSEKITASDVAAALLDHVSPRNRALTA